MTKKRIAILGGGIGALTTAHELTRTPELRARYDVTIHSLGWRLGGKCASARNASQHQRIEEHGLHIWLGCYDNAFALMREVFQELARGPGEPLRNLEEAFLPQSFTPIGLGDGSTFFPLFWPPNANTPGRGGLFPSPWGAVTECLGVLKRIAGELLGTVQPAREKSFAQVAEVAEVAASSSVEDRLEQAHALAKNPGQGTPSDDDLDGILRNLEEAQGMLDPLRAAKGLRSAARNPRLRFLEDLLIVAGAAVRGVWALRDQGFNLDLIDGEDFRAWLVRNGAPARFMDLEQVSFLRALYDLPFAYRPNPGGQPVPDFAAGTALRCVIRICATYKQAVLFEMAAGMGEAVIAPLHEVLSRRGVKFEYFHKVKRLELSADKRDVARVRLGQQAALREPQKGYQPLIQIPIEGYSRPLASWPSEPLWEQLVDGERLRNERPDFESHWCTEPDASERVLERGVDFDDVVLAIPVGAFKALNAQDEALCQELIDASPRFKSMCEQLGQIPTLALQLWMTRDLKALGWDLPRPAANGLIEPVDVWADETHLLKMEGWPGGQAPRSLHYFCGPLNTDLHREPASHTQVPSLALNQVVDIATHWFSRNTATLWPKAVGPDGRALSPAALYGGAGTLREGLEAQYLRANVDPTECCTTSLTGSTAVRLDPGASGFRNLFLAGSWTRTGFNAECVEGTVMSGMRAAQALSGVKRDIVGWNFMGPKDT
ncbi:hypothetical protein COCOR_06777 [Corallococcus coralloides DSM 2259]|uniref:Amine oxidase domain-containing protein n=1 Tax=Corallococcus coralloides (strain ATCC 25202 / DSM 2259 / NBRC 100086 / M2) TaxID=1144275 RepID=H8MZE1_CORCM|nr:FAD-dependent oxidoreductase [Corallococcus coralloides]AFE07120.1 hypothetical protein COCOR_06777 [Corallococcus coralloides DSM 2259]